MQSMYYYFLLSILGFATVSFGQNPVGELAKYKLDRSRSRTSSIFMNGNFQAEVTAHVPEGEDGPSYNNFYRYDFFLRIMGRQKGDGNFELIEEVYTPEFISRLKVEQEISTTQFKARYLGQEDVRTGDGSQYPGSEYISIYDIDLSQINGLSTFIRDLFISNNLLGKPIGGTEELQDLKIKVAVHPNVPVIGGAKIDLSGIYQGVNFKAGFDYQKP